MLPIPNKPLHTPIAIPITSDKQAWLDLRKSDVTGTEVSILLGRHYNIDLFTYWHTKRGTLAESFEETNFSFWGRNNETAIAQGIFDLEGWEKQGLKLVKATNYYRHPAIEGSGATCDYLLESKGGAFSLGGDRIILEIKNVSEMAWRESWVRDGVNTPPIYYELQLQQQLSVTGYSHGIIAPLVGGNEHHIFIRARNEPVIKQIERKISEFWAMEEPNVLEHSTSEATLKSLFKPDGTYKDLSEDGNAKYLFAMYMDKKYHSDLAGNEKDHARLELIKLLGTNSRVRCGEYVISKASDDSIRIITQRKKLELKI